MKSLGRLLARTSRTINGMKSPTSPLGGKRCDSLFSPRVFSSSASSIPFYAQGPYRSSHLGSSKPSNLSPWMGFGGQKRSMFIQTQSTPNPLSLMFYPGKPVMEVGSADFPNARTAMTSPLAKSLFGIDGITRVFFGSDFVTVTKSEEASWDFLKPEIFAAIMDFYSSGKSLFLDSNVAASMDTAIHEDDSEIVAMIKELLETRIRPAVQDDGGDIEYCGFDPESGIVKLRMQGACSGCPSSSVTLKSGIENMLMHYVPEIKGVEQELDDVEEDAALTNQMD
ncbi:nifU-like protein 4, mitochondrial [Typha latifolia]|uniref:nifU-like protein 4, mitochondrial n=1 Tax=Typha latifolia TaxID=4733 RepID=UPI003C2CA74E